MKNRIKEIRLDAGDTQTEFGAKLGVKGNTITNYENGLRNPSEAIIFSICREFSVNEEWLRTGKGEKYKAVEDKLETYLGQISRGNDDFIKDIIEIYMELDQSSKDALKEISIRMAVKQKERERK